MIGKFGDWNDKKQVWQVWINIAKVGIEKNPDPTRSGEISNLFTSDELEVDWTAYSLSEKERWYNKTYGIDIKPWSSIKVTYKDGGIKEGIVDEDLGRFTYAYKNSRWGINKKSLLLINPWIIKNIEVLVPANIKPEEEIWKT